MAIKDSLLPEYDHEMGATRRLLERVPETDFGWKPTVPASRDDLLQRFDTTVKKGRAKLDEQSDATMAAVWTFKNAGHEIFTMPRVAVVRSFIMNHMIHHRGQLTVYLRLRNVPLPSLYGPTADEG